MVARIFAVLAAISLVVAVGVAALTPLGLTLAQGLLKLDHTALEWLRGHSPGWVMTYIEMPFLLRPLWLLPASLGRDLRRRRGDVQPGQGLAVAAPPELSRSLQSELAAGEGDDAVRLVP